MARGARWRPSCRRVPGYQETRARSGGPAPGAPGFPEFGPNRPQRRAGASAGSRRAAGVVISGSCVPAFGEGPKKSSKSGLGDRIFLESGRSRRLDSGRFESANGVSGQVSPHPFCRFPRIMEEARRMLVPLSCWQIPAFCMVGRTAADRLIGVTVSAPFRGRGPGRQAVGCGTRTNGFR